MSPRHMMLGSGVVLPNGGTTPTGPPAPTSTPFTLPTVDDAVVMQMRPDLPPAAAFTIAQDGSGDFTTFASAVAFVEEARSLAMAMAGATQPDPRFRVDFGVKPGRFAEKLPPIPSFTAWYALDPTPGATVLDWGISTPNSTRGGVYWEGIDINNPTSVFEPKYPVHHANYGTSIFTRCTLNNNSTGAGGGATGIGMDGADDGMLVLHDVVFTVGGTNLHGWPFGQKTRPETIVFSKVRALEKTATYQIGYAAGNDEVADAVWFVDTHAALMAVSGAKTRMHVSECTGETRHTTSGGDPIAVTDTRSDWPVPVGGLSAHDRQKWGL